MNCNQLIDVLRKNHPSMVVVNVAIADLLIRKHKNDLIKARNPFLVNAVAWLQYFASSSTYVDPVIYLQFVVQQRPHLSTLLPKSDFKLKVDTDPPLNDELPWFNHVHYGDRWVLIGNPNEPLQSLINAIHFNDNQTDNCEEDYIVVYLSDQKLIVFESRKTGSNYDVIFEESTEGRSPLMIRAKGRHVKPHFVRIQVMS